MPRASRSVRRTCRSDRTGPASRASLAGADHLAPRFAASPMRRTDGPRRSSRDTPVEDAVPVLVSGRLRLMRDLLEYRSEFPILEHTTYLASHTLGPMPRQAAARLAAFARIWAERGIRAWAEGWWRTP